MTNQTWNWTEIVCYKRAKITQNYFIHIIIEKSPFNFFECICIFSVYIVWKMFVTSGSKNIEKKES